MNYEGIAKELGTADLIAVYNNYSPTAVKKFSDKKTGIKRVFQLLDDLQPDADDMCLVIGLSDEGKDIIKSYDSRPLVVVTRMEKKPAVTAKTEGQAPAKERKKGNTGNRNKGKFLYRANEEKLRKGSRRHDNFLKITDGMTFEQYKEKGGNGSDLSIMIRDGVVRAEELK